MYKTKATAQLPNASIKLSILATAKQLLCQIPFASNVKQILCQIPLVQKLHPNWRHVRRHPIDDLYGIDTSDMIPANRLYDKQFSQSVNGYVGAQPSIVRQAFNALGNIETYTLVDLGCGKGRITVLGSEFHFQSISGIELSHKLAKIARTNAEKIKRNFPSRPDISILESDAVATPLPKGHLVLFMYHAFGPELMSRLINNLEAALLSDATHIFVVYYNPVYASIIDSSSAFQRWYAKTLSYASSEIGYGPDADDTVVIWQSVRNAVPTPHQDAERAVTTLKPLWRAGLEE